MIADSILLKFAVALFLFVGRISAQKQLVIIKGTTRYCGAGSPGTLWHGMKVSAFDMRSLGGQRLLRTLRRMDKVEGSDAAAMTRFFAGYDSVEVAVKRNRALSRATTNSAGQFTLTFASADSILVFAFEELEDEPTFYTYRVVGARSSKSIVLNIHGDCTH